MITKSFRFWTVGFTAIALIAGAFALLPKGAHNSTASAKPGHQFAAQQQPRVETVQFKIVPAEATKSAFIWAPPTGEN